MGESKRLYFIPIIARALASEDSKNAMKDAFDEIQELGYRQEFKEGYRQFIEFVNTATGLSEETPSEKISSLGNALSRLIDDLACDTFEGDEEEREALITALKNIPESSAEYERISDEARAFLAPETPIEVEVLRDDKMIALVPISPDTVPIGSILPGTYTVRLSNGRVLWEGALTKEDVIWAFAFPARDLPMAAATETHQPQPARTIPLLNGELMMYVYAGLESGRIRIKSEQGL